MSAKIVCRGGKLIPWIVQPDGDPTWSAADWGRAATLEARFARMGVSEMERRRLVPCAVWKAKWPETTFCATTERRLAPLLCR